jgi:hypothetical protein
MATTERVETELDPWRPLSWSALIFGAIVALAIALMLHILGLGVAASAADPSEGVAQNLLTLGGVAGIWWIVSTAIGLFVGGFVAANISRTFSDERAVLYGLGVWGISALITIVVAASSLGSLTANVARTTGEIAGGTLQAAGNVAGQAASGIAQTVLPAAAMQRLDRIFRGTSQGRIDPQGAQDILRIIQQAVAQGQLTPNLRQQLESAVATTFNIPQDEARNRVSAAQQQLNSAIAEVRQTAREAAAATLSAVSATAYWAFAAIIIGLIAALIGARFGSLDEQDLPRFARLRFFRAIERRG